MLRSVLRRREHALDRHGRRERADDDAEHDQADVADALPLGRAACAEVQQRRVHELSSETEKRVSIIDL